MRAPRRDAEAELRLPPGFRFHPTDEELVVHYLCRRVSCQRLPVPIIAEVDLYKFDPWDLPERALFGQREWYFFTPRDRKYPNGSRPNRAAGRGYWKATGADKPVRPDGHGRPLGIKKALVFYHGKAPRGVKTDWIMHEYRLATADSRKGTLRLDDWVLCRLYNKKNSRDKSPAAAQPEASHDTAGSAQESDIEHEGFPVLSSAGRRPPDTGMLHQMMTVQKQEENDWFTDLNLDDLQGPLAGFGDGPSLQDYFLQGPGCN